MTSLLIAGYFAQSRWRRLRSRAAVDRLQERYVRRQFRFLRRHSPYFAALPEVGSLADLGKLPVMDKESMMANFNQLNTVGLDRDRVVVGDEWASGFVYCERSGAVYVGWCGVGAVFAVAFGAADRVFSAGE